MKALTFSGKFFVVTSFAIAMGFLESAVVVYMRALLYPEGFDFPLSPIPPQLALTEILREAATLVMLITISMLAARRFSTRFAWFLYSFAIWDLFYYLFLWLLLGWPQSLLTWDILFLIPTTWTGPVVSPVIVALTMILFALIILIRAERNLPSFIPERSWLFLIAGSLVLIFSWILDYSRHMLEHFSTGALLRAGNPEVLEWAMRYEPGHFPWPIFIAGELIVLTGIWFYIKNTRK